MTKVPRRLQDILFEAAARHPDRIALVAGNSRLSYRELFDHSCRLALTLQECGIHRGDRVVIFMDNVWQCASAIFGVLMAGCVFVAVNAQTKRYKLDFIIRDSGARILLSEPQLGREFRPVAENLPELKVLCIGAENLPDGVENLDKFMGNMPPVVPPQLSISLDLAALIYTSGTTGDPKGVMHTHQSLLSVLDSINEYLGFSEDDRLFCALPLSFGYGLFQWFSAVRAGATLVLERSFTYPAEVFKRMHDEAVTSFAGVPTIFSLMLSMDAKQRLSFPSVRLVTNAAAALPVQFISGIRRLFPHAGLYKMYGQTECIRIAYLKPALAEAKPDSVGCAIPGTELLLLGDDGQPVKPGEVGALYVRGPHLMRGYWNQPEKTAGTLIPGELPGEFILKTGDQFRQDEDGDFYFVARSDEIIKCRGEKVSPTEVENVIYVLPEVHEVVVAGIPDQLLGQAVCAFVSLREGAELNEHKVKQVCSERLENFMIPKHVVFLPELPRTANGKLSRKLILEHSASLLAAPV